MIKHKFPAVAVGLVALGAVLLAACAGGGTNGSTTKTTMTIGQTAGVTNNFNPYSLQPGNFVFMYQLYDTLIREGSDLKPQPRLATSWNLAKDGLSLTLHMRQARFSNGQPITSRDVAYDVNLVQQKATDANIRSLAKHVTSVGTPDTQTVVLQFAKPFPGVFDLLNLLFISDKDTVASKYLTVDASGPFKLANYAPGTSFSLTPNPYFWGTKPKLHTVTVKIMPDEQTMISSLQAGTIDFADQISPLDYKTLKANPTFKVGAPAATNSVFAFTINVSKTPLNRVDVRQALSLALDRKKIADNFLYGAGKPACLPFNTPTQLGYDKSLGNSCKFDLNAAKTKLTSAGVRGLSFTIITSTAVNPVYTQMSETFQADLAKIGVTAQIQNVDQSAWHDRPVSGDFQVLAQSYGRANLDPSSLFGADLAWAPTNNISHMVNPTYASLVTQADASDNATERANLYRQIDQIILQQDFVLNVATNARPYATSSAVHGLQYALNGQPILQGVTSG